MGNMDYCRFENTSFDLEDVINNWYEDLSESEEKERQRIIKLAKEICEMEGIL
jgi:hypothetical protein